MKKTETATPALVKAKKKRNLAPYLLLLPPVLLVLIFMVYPIGYVFRLSFYDYNPVMPWLNGFKGFGNFVAIITGSEFWQAMLVSLKWVFWEVILQFTLGLIIALLLNQKFKARGFFRALIFIPWAMSGVLTAVLWNLIYNQNIGILNDLLMKLHIVSEPVDWLVSAGTALAAIIAVNCWVGIPFNILLLTSGLTGISDDIYESASIDGANKFQRFLYITLPLMKPAMLSVLMLGFIYTFKAFDLMYIMTQGGPFNSTDVLGTYAYSEAFTQYEFSKGSAIAMVLFVCLFLVGLFYLKLLSKEDD